MMLRLRSSSVRRLALLLAAMLVAAGCSLPGNVTGAREITADFTDVGDLVVGHSVQVADVRVGAVIGIELTDEYRARVTMSIKDDVFIPIESQALLRTTSLLGEKFIELRPLDSTDPMAGTDLVDGDVIARTAQAPELEFVAEQAVQVLGGVVASDLAVIVQTGAVGFGGRGAELTSILDGLSTVTATLADQTDEIVRIIDALDGASATLAAGDDSIDALLRNLADATTVLADNRTAAIDAIEELTRLAQVQNDIVFEPYLGEISKQLTQLDAILDELGRDQTQIDGLLRILDDYVTRLPLVIPDNFAQVYGWFEDVEP